MDLEAVWAQREEQIYPALFGPVSRGIFTLDQALFERFGQADIDPRWLFYGVLEFAPTEQRPSWLYVTSGCSNPWDQEPHDYDPAGESGAGVEFVLQAASPGDWAVTVLRNMLAFDLLLAHGRYPGREALGIGDRVPLQESIDGREDGLVRNLVLTEAEGIAAGFTLASGKVLLPSFTGITDAEAEFARANSSEDLIKRLRDAGHHPATDPRRASLF